MRGLLYKIQHKSITSFAEGNVLDVATCMQCLSEKNIKHFAGSRINWIQRSRQKNAGSGERIAELRRSTRQMQSVFKVSSWRLYNVYNQQDQKPSLTI